jgi:hypothetical protein
MARRLGKGFIRVPSSELIGLKGRLCTNGECVNLAVHQVAERVMNHAMPDDKGFVHEKLGHDMQIIVPAALRAMVPEMARKAARETRLGASAWRRARMRFMVLSLLAIVVPISIRFLDQVFG